MVRPGLTTALNVLKSMVCVLAIWAAAGCGPAAAPAATATVAAPASATATLPPSHLPPTASPAPPTASATASPTATARATATTAPSSTTAATGSPTTAPQATATAPPATKASSDFTPTAASVWNTVIVGSDSMSGNCSGPLTPVYGLVQITPNGDALTWRNQEPAPYTLSRAGPNAWQYSGPTAVGDGTVTLSVKFTSATTLEMTRTFAPGAEPGCTHTHAYTGTFQWFS